MLRTKQTIQINLPAPAPLSREAYFARAAPIPGRAPTPRLALGAAGLGGVWGKVDADESIAVLHDAWRAGFLLTDASPNYGHGAAENVVGAALRTWNGPDPILCTKIEGWGELYVPRPGESWRQTMERQYQTSLQRFHGRPIDGLAIHDAESCAPEFLPACIDFVLERLDRGEIAAAGFGGGGPTVQLPSLAAHPGRFGYVITYLRIGAVTLQGLADLAPAAQAAGAKLVAASPVFMGLLGPRLDDYLQKPKSFMRPVHIARAQAARRLAAEAGIPLTHLALRFLLSTPTVDLVLAGAGKPASWADTVAAYEAGPLPSDLYAKVWANAQAHGPEPLQGG